jgi:Protein-L-isoaspartate(D-aspartate) O-methyltransferase (PCMT)
MTAISEITEAMAGQLTAARYLTDPSWLPVLHAVPRHLFASARCYAVAGTTDAPPDHGIDPALAATAARNLATARCASTVITGDGEQGVPGEAFSRLHVTCGISAVPPAWITQLQPGGIAVLPWMPGGWSGWKVRITAMGDGTAVGTFHGPATYMMLRAQRVTPVLWRPHSLHDTEVSTTSLDPRDAAAARQQVAFAQVPGLVITTCTEDGLASVHLAEAGAPDGSWAACDEEPGGRHLVTQHGQRRLWDEFEAVFRDWDASGRPGPAGYRLVITPDGQAVTPSSRSGQP